jgi:hypothetical protein
MQSAGSDELPIEIVRRFSNRGAPVNVDSLALELGLKVHRDASLGPEISGKIIKALPPTGGPTGYAIFVNYTHPSGRQRFTIAHEIAHFVLHRDLIGDGIEDDALYRSKLNEWYETQANRMAADILLPADLVREAYRVHGIKSLAGLSARFEVSVDAIRIRLKELSLAP